VSISTQQIAVGTSAVSLSSGAAVSRGGVARVTLYNPGSVLIYVGSVSVSTANGLAIAPGAYVSLELTGGDSMYAVAAAAGQALHVFYQTA
jgi:hypothetical protein